ncbi:MAG: VCBS repeat-containing protein [Planctomycetaceae bacterium]|nr:VCBS repeat-containing protein [Planctomycetaceae bacterium]
MLFSNGLRAIWGLGVVIVAGLFIWWWLYPSVDLPREIRSVRSLLRKGQFQEAIVECDQLLRVAPAESEVLVVKGECLQRLNRLDEAMKVFAVVENDGTQHALAARLTEASVFLQQGMLTSCLSKLDQAERISADSPTLFALKASALTAAGLRWESMPYLRKSLDAGVGDTLANLIYLAVPDQMPQPNENYLELVLKNEDEVGSVGAARVAMALGISDRAESLLSRTVAGNPTLDEARIQLATLYLNSNRYAEFFETLLTGGTRLRNHPEFWLLVGRYMQETGQGRTAIRCYWEVLIRHPDQDRACYQLGQLLAAEGDLQRSKPYIERAGRLAQLVEKASLLYDHPTDRDAMVKCAETTYELGRYRESRYWCELILQDPPPGPTLERVRMTLVRLQQQDDSWQDGGLNVAANINLQEYALPNFEEPDVWQRQFTQSNQTGTVTDAPEDQDRVIHFANDAEAAGLVFSYRNGSDPNTEGRRMFEYTGGGVAAFDFDGDGYDDIHLTQGTDWPQVEGQTRFLDQTFRNIRSVGFQDVSNQVGLTDSRFSQGVTSGDFNNDGLPDLYIANIGGNCLYQNNGDGTFSDVTLQSGVGHEYWTTSCAFADLNGDGLPDIYDVTFLQGHDVFERICTGEGGIPRSCAPAAFDAAPDFVWENLGDGTFRQFNPNVGFDSLDGDGLGILISDFDLSGNLSIFVANDGRANFFLVPQADEESGTVWQETGVLNGTAFDASGRAQACMGVACADFDRNGFIDLFVTNFYQESNTLYVNMGANTFLDQTRRVGLHDPSYGFLGFGTQFLDADLDGWQDLIVTNGHVDDFRHRNIPYRMKPQLFLNSQGRRFQEVDQNRIGEFFATEHMGRGMAKLDWNRDFLADVVINQLDEPAALLTNHSIPVGQGTAVRVVNRDLDRDAVGTRLTVETGAVEDTFVMNAGDGYQASNSREVITATRSSDGEFRLSITWRSGETQVHDAVRPGQRYVAVSGRKGLYLVP